MSSATSTDRPVRVGPDAGVTPASPLAADADDAGFRPLHFFVLASLAAATVAVVMSRQSTPAHLILLSLTIGAAGAAAGALYRTLAPLAVRDVTLLSEKQSERARGAIEREKALVLRSIKELEFDRAMGKVSPRDFEEMAGRLRARAMMLMKQVDEGGAGYGELIEKELSARLATRGAGKAGLPSSQAAPAVTGRGVRDADAGVIDPGGMKARGPDTTGSECAACGTANDADASFCKRCGTKLAVPA
jgi:hypothetical protein